MQIINGIPVEIVEFDTMPELPITGLTEGEQTYYTALAFARGYRDPIYDPRFPRTGRVATALQKAIENGIITEPGKYGIHFPYGTEDYQVFAIIE